MLSPNVSDTPNTIVVALFRPTVRDRLAKVGMSPIR